MLNLCTRATVGGVSRPAVIVTKWEALRWVPNADPHSIRATVIGDALPGLVAHVTIRPDSDGWSLTALNVEIDQSPRRDVGAIDGGDSKRPDVAAAVASVDWASTVRAVIAQLTFAGSDDAVSSLLMSAYDDGTRRVLDGAPVPSEPKAPRRGRPPLADEQIREWAEMTLRLNADGRGDIHRRLAERLTADPDDPKNLAMARDRIKRAREVGFLAPARHRGQKYHEAGPLLLDRWRANGFPEWHSSDDTTDQKGDRK